MQCLRNAQAIDNFLLHAPDPEIRALINERLAELTEFDDVDLSDLVNFYVVGPANFTPPSRSHHDRQTDGQGGS